MPSQRLNQTERASRVLLVSIKTKRQNLHAYQYLNAGLRRKKRQCTRLQLIEFVLDARTVFSKRKLLERILAFHGATAIQDLLLTPNPPLALTELAARAVQARTNQSLAKLIAGFGPSAMQAKRRR